MNQLQVVIDENGNDVNLFGIQLEAPMSNDVGKSLYHKPFGLVIDAVKQATYSG